jgi:hypothetical protein
VVGLPGTLAALNAGRVERLLIEPDRPFRGTAGADESMVVDETGPDLADRIVAAALVAGADILPVKGEAASALADGGGIGALLRW